MKFILISHGLNELAIKRISVLVSKPVNKIKILYIDTPARVYPPNPDWLLESINELKQADFLVQTFDLEYAFINKLNLENEFKSYDIVAVSGGNTFNFLYWAEKVNFKLILSKFLKNGGVYMGESAGVVCHIKDLTPIAWLDDPNEAPGPVKEGLQVMDMIVIPHWKNPKYQIRLEDTRNYYQEKGLNPTVIEDGEVLIVDGDKVEKF